MTSFRARSIVLLLALIFAAPVRADSPATANLLVNGDFAKGSADQPDEWRTEAWINSPEAFSHHWGHPDGGGPNELEVDNLQANDARWEQAVSLSEGLYHLSTEIRTENVGTGEDGGSVSIMSDGMMSHDLRGTNGWQRVGFYFKVGRHGADIDVALRVGGYGNLNTGRAFFRDARLEKIAALPAGAAPFFDWDAIQKEETPPPIGSPWTIVLVLIALGAIITLGWWMHGDQPLPVPASPPPESRKSKGTKRR
jgi:dolichyl-phosphate-mannose-protein mannosyltransferase